MRTTIEILAAITTEFVGWLLALASLITLLGGCECLAQVFTASQYPEFGLVPVNERSLMQDKAMHPSTCRVRVRTRNGFSGGSGVLTDLGDGRNRAIVASAAHVFRGRRSNAVDLSFTGRKVQGTVVYCNTKSDVAFLAVDNKHVKSITRTRIASVIPSVGDSVKVEGFGTDGPGFSTGKVRSLKWQFANVESLSTTASVMPGDSGGPIRNERGELVSVVLGGHKRNECEGPRTDWLWRGIKEAGLRRLYPCPDCMPQQPVVTSPPAELEPEPEPTPAEPKVIVGPPGPQGPQGPPGVVDRKIIREIVEAVVDNIPKPPEIPDALRVELVDETTGDPLFQQTYQLRGQTGIVAIRIPYQRPQLTRSGSFQIQVP